MICPNCGKEINEEYTEAKLGKLTFRIYKWSKPVKDLKIPKKGRIAEEREFIDLYDSGFKIENYPVVYFTKNRSKLNIKNGWGLSRLCLNGGLNLGSYLDLANSSDSGRVVLVSAEGGAR